MELVEALEDKMDIESPTKALKHNEFDPWK